MFYRKKWSSRIGLVTTLLVCFLTPGPADSQPAPKVTQDQVSGCWEGCSNAKSACYSNCGTMAPMEDPCLSKEGKCWCSCQKKSEACVKSCDRIKQQLNQESERNQKKLAEEMRRQEERAQQERQKAEAQARAQRQQEKNIRGKKRVEPKQREHQPVDHVTTSIPLAEKLWAPRLLAADGTHLFWAHESDKKCMVTRISLTDRKIMPFLSTCSLVASDGATVFWNKPSTRTTPGRLISTPILGGPSKVLVNNLPPLNWLKVDNLNIYWAQTKGEVTPGKTSLCAIIRLPKSGGTLTTLHTDIPCDAPLDVDQSGLYWIEKTNHPNRLLYLKGDGSPAITISSDDNIMGLAIDEQNVYWAVAGSNKQANGLILKQPKNGGKPTLLFRRLGLLSSNLVVSNGMLFFYDQEKGGDGKGDGRLLKLSTFGGPHATLVSGMNSSSLKIIVDSRNVYWSEFPLNAPGKPVSEGKVMMIPR